MLPPRVEITPAAAARLDKLAASASGSATCTSARWPGRRSTIGDQQYEYWKHTGLTVDVVPGRGSGFSVEAPEGVRFLTRSRLFTDEEWAALEAAGPAPRGPGTMGEV